MFRWTLHEVWLLTVAQRSEERRELTSLTGYAEFTSSGNYEAGPGESAVFPVHHPNACTTKPYPPSRSTATWTPRNSDVDEKIVVERFSSELDRPAGILLVREQGEVPGPYRGYGNPVGGGVAAPGRCAELQTQQLGRCPPVDARWSLDSAVTIAFPCWGSESRSRRCCALHPVVSGPAAVCAKSLGRCRFLAGQAVPVPGQDPLPGVRTP